MSGPANPVHDEARPGGRAWMIVVVVLTLLAGMVGWWLYSFHKTDQARFTSVVLPAPPDLRQPLAEDDALKLAYEALEKMGEKRETWTPVAVAHAAPDKYLIRNGPERARLMFSDAKRETIFVDVEVTGKSVECTRVKPW